ncbi:uncharacterized protein LOC129191595 [Dunckerocampus dactyliophorus]|uniref:uncharacterized protein LOC129191595 n=1 Tax=Dunckerocampus dactyliophorus TaxID=161453 RepID=UPI002405C23B|nr:uncharacterized protein LOC129191595 [Dunckerocampus dactyliophorus]
MSGLAFCPRRSDKENKPIYGSQNKDTDCLQEFSECAACKRNDNVTLILPCSHAMCMHCISAEKAKRSARSPRHHLSCSVLCPLCRYDVELPCKTWASALSCLPKYPTLKSARGSQETDRQPPEHMQGEIYSVVADDETAQCSSACSFATPPVESNVDLREEDMERSVFGIRFALDPLTAPTSLHLSNSSLIVAYREEIPPGPRPDNNVRRSMMTSDPGVTHDIPQVCADVIIAQGQYYWEVDVYNSSIYRIGVSSLDSSEGWWLERHGLSFCTDYDGCKEPLFTVPPQIKTLGLFLNFGGGALSFYNPVTQEHLVTLPTCFNASGVLPTLGLGQGLLRMRCGLPPPHYVFLSKNSAYRGPHGASRGQWYRDMTFQSVRKVIQKFEDLSASNSRLRCLVPSGHQGTNPSRLAGQETGPE